MNSIKNKTAIIIGGTRGIGQATANALLEAGAHVHIVGRNPDKVSNLAGATKHKVDITDRAAVADFINQIAGFDQLDYLVNASGIFGPKPFLDHTLEDYDSYLDLNRGFFFITQATAKK
ncbi:MAG: SDR family NAD(P)-dependent oxidoreductase [Bacteroidota bacterium]